MKLNNLKVNDIYNILLKLEFFFLGEKNEINFLIIGDFGYFENDYTVKDSTKRLADFVVGKSNARFTKYDFILSTGDNIYDDGILEESNDKRVMTLFNETFKAEELGIEWYSVLGN